MKPSSSPTREIYPDFWLSGRAVSFLQPLSRGANEMAETLLQYQHPVMAPDGTLYEARACGGPMPVGMWQGWIEFVPLDGGEPVRSPRETTQPNRVDTEYWATGVTAVYLEGALVRALAKPATITPMPAQPAMFRGPAPSPVSPVESGTSSVLNPFSVYEKGEPLLRKQLGALSAWHLVNIVLAYQLSDASATALNRLPAPALIGIIVAGVRKELEAAVRQR
jgi:hypothetical protein